MDFVVEGGKLQVNMRTCVSHNRNRVCQWAPSALGLGSLTKACNILVFIGVWIYVVNYCVVGEMNCFIPDVLGLANSSI